MPLGGGNSSVILAAMCLARDKKTWSSCISMTPVSSVKTSSVDIER